MWMRVYACEIQLNTAGNMIALFIYFLIKQLKLSLDSLDNQKQNAQKERRNLI